MTTAIIGTGGIGSAIARQLAAGGETLQLSSADKESARKLAAAIGGAAVVALLPEGQSSGQVVAGWLPIGTRFAIAFGTMSADLFESSSHRSPDPAVLFYVSDDDRAGEEVERLIRRGGLEPVKVVGGEQSARLEVGGDLHDRVVGLVEARSLTDGA